MQAVGRGGGGDGGIDHAGLDDGETLGGVDAEDAVEAVERDHESTGDGRGAAGQAGAAAAGHEGELLLVAETDEGDDLGLSLGDDDGERRGAEGGEAVAFIGGELGRSGEHARGREQSGEAAETTRGVGDGRVKRRRRGTHGC